MTYNSYNLFITSFSMPSIALSNSASDAFFHTSHSRMRSEMNCDQRKSCALRGRELVRDLTFRKSLMSLTWSFTVNVRFAKLLRNLLVVSKRRTMSNVTDVRPEVLRNGLCPLHLHLVKELLEVELWRILLLPLARW